MAGEAPRRGLGVAVDPELELPPAATTGSSEKGIVVLAAPVDVRPALRVVSDFFEAASTESIEMMERLLDRAAHTRGSPKARPEAALPSWRRRFDRLDYTPLATMEKCVVSTFGIRACCMPSSPSNASTSLRPFNTR